MFLKKLTVSKDNSCISSFGVTYVRLIVDLRHLEGGIRTHSSGAAGEGRGREPGQLAATGTGETSSRQHLEDD